MRFALRKLVGRTLSFIATFDHFGRDPRKPGKRTVLLVDVTDGCGKPVTDHLWLSFTRRFRSLALRGGELLQFEATVRRYRRRRKLDGSEAFWSVEYDYGLRHPVNLRRLDMNWGAPPGQRPDVRAHTVARSCLEGEAVSLPRRLARQAEGCREVEWYGLRLRSRALAARHRMRSITWYEDTWRMSRRTERIRRSKLAQRRVIGRFGTVFTLVEVPAETGDCALLAA